MHLTFATDVTPAMYELRNGLYIKKLYRIALEQDCWGGIGLYDEKRFFLHLDMRVVEETVHWREA